MNFEILNDALIKSRTSSKNLVILCGGVCSFETFTLQQGCAGERVALSLLRFHSNKNKILMTRIFDKRNEYFASTLFICGKDFQASILVAL